MLFILALLSISSIFLLFGFYCCICNFSIPSLSLFLFLSSMVSLVPSGLFISKFDLLIHE
nr:MAG TPA: hypothetical protein [Crassvirales sp.]